jgi:hypothetical protein
MPGRQHRPAGPAGPLVVAGAVLAGVLSLLIPITPTYDPWAWLIWAREILHLDLVTPGGPSWKPLPVLIDVPFALLGDDLAPSLWLVVARASGALALVLALTLGWKLAGRGVPGIAGGLVAALGILVMTGWLRGLARGNSEGLLIALVLAAVDRHLEGRRDQAFVLGAAAALLRPEIWPFLALYGVVLWTADPRRRARIPAVAVVVLALWFLPELWGSGDLLRSAERANDPLPTSIAYADHPAVEVLRSSTALLLAPLYAAALVALCAAVVAFRRRRDQGAVLGIAGLAAGWTGLIMLMTEAGYSGNPRYLMLPCALVSVLAGVGVARFAHAAGDAARHLGAGARAGAVVGAAVLVGVLAPTWPGRELAADLRAVRSESAATPQLEQLVARLGGPAAVLDCGRPTAGLFQRPVMAWTLGVHVGDVAFILHPGAPGLVFRTRAQRVRDRPLPDSEPRYDAVAEHGQWEVFAARCTRGRDPAAYRAAAGWVRLPPSSGGG